MTANLGMAAPKKLTTADTEDTEGREKFRYLIVHFVNVDNENYFKINVNIAQSITFVNNFSYLHDNIHILPLKRMFLMVPIFVHS